MSTSSKDKRMRKREEEMASFICTNYCQFCENRRCNVAEIMEKHQDNLLTPSQN